MQINADDSELISVQPSSSVNSIVAYNQWGMGSDVGINVRRGNVVVCALDLTVAEALALAEELEKAAIGAKYMSLGYQLSQMPD